jgi:hypothetical protein
MEMPDFDDFIIHDFDDKGNSPASSSSMSTSSAASSAQAEANCGNGIQPNGGNATPANGSNGTQTNGGSGTQTNCGNGTQANGNGDHDGGGGVHANNISVLTGATIGPQGLDLNAGVDGAHLNLGATVDLDNGNKIGTAAVMLAPGSSSAPPARPGSRAAAVKDRIARSACLEGREPEEIRAGTKRIRWL